EHHFLLFFFQAEDGIRDFHVTGVQTCALPIYSEARLQSAVRNQTNKDIAASIIGYIRRAALGEPLIPFEQRVAEAMDRIYTQHNWTPNQRKWLERLAKQLVHEVIIDREFVNHRFADDGGARQMDKVLGAQLDTVLEELNEAMWPERIA